MQNKIYVFVDNSNIFIEGQKHYGKIHMNPDFGHRYRLDFGKLFKHISQNRGDIFFEKIGIQYPRLYGSEPPKMDSLWTFLKNMKVNVQVFKRNAFNKEKGVDIHLAYDAFRLFFKTETQDNSNHVIAIIGGDADFLKIYTEGTKIGYRVEFYCWEHSTSSEIMKLPTYFDLTPHINEIGFLENDVFEHDFGEIDWGKVVPYYK